MPGIFDKLNLNGAREIVVLDAPASFARELRALDDVKVVRSLADIDNVTFALVFATRKSQLDRLSKAVVVRACGDAILWFAYPKGTSRSLQCDFNRDHGWDVIRKAGWDSVRQVAIDADWSALRFRRNEFIKRRAR